MDLRGQSANVGGRKMVMVDFPGFHPWARARTRYGSYYDSQAELKESLFYYFHEALKNNGGKPLDGPLGLVAFFYRKRPKGHTKKQRDNPYCTVRPDLDNLEKFVLDCSQTHGLITDDSKIVSKFSLKLWGKDDRTIFVFDGWDNRSRVITGFSDIRFNGRVFSFGSLCG